MCGFVEKVNIATGRHLRVPIQSDLSGPSHSGVNRVTHAIASMRRKVSPALQNTKLLRKDAL